MTRRELVMIYGADHGVSPDYVNRLLRAFDDDAGEVSFVATMEPYHGVLMLGILRGDVALPVGGGFTVRNAADAALARGVHPATLKAEVQRAYDDRLLGRKTQAPAHDEPEPTA